MNAPLPLPPAIRAATALIGEAVRAHDNYDTDLCGLAIAAVNDGRAAFWTTERYHNQVARNFARIANERGIHDALQECVRTGNVHTSAVALTGTLIALNSAAAASLSYWKSEAPWIDAPGAKAGAA
jgi:hypothetical protein